MKLKTPDVLTDNEWHYVKKTITDQNIIKMLHAILTSKEASSAKERIISRIKATYQYHENRPILLKVAGCFALMKGMTPADYMPPLKFSANNLRKYTATPAKITVEAPGSSTSKQHKHRAKD